MRKLAVIALLLAVSTSSFAKVRLWVSEKRADENFGDCRGRSYVKNEFLEVARQIEEETADFDYKLIKKDQDGMVYQFIHPDYKNKRVMVVHKNKDGCAKLRQWATENH